MSSVAPSAAKKDIVVQAQVPESAVEGYVDPERYGQVLDNLLSNAVKFTPRGGRINVSLAAKDESAIIGVEDTGAGLSPGQQKQLFQAFSRMHGAMAPGLGLGLVISRAIVEQHGGRIWAESEGPDRGSQFWVSLPRRAPDTFSPASAAPTPAPSGAAPFGL